jgi:hypothetical protein
MAEEAGTITPAGGETTTPDGDAATTATTFTPPASQADLDRIIGDRIARERAKFGDYDEVKKKAAEYDKAIDAAKTDQQRLEDRANVAEAKVPGLEAENLRLRIALDKGLSLDLLGRLNGETKEELEADADALLAMFAPGAQASSVPDLRRGAGQRPVQADATADDWLRRMAGRQ